MISSWQTEALLSNQCRNCSRQSDAPTNFCRWCGFHQGRESAEAEKIDPHHSSTKLLGDYEESPETFSRRSLATVRQSVAVKTGPLRLNRLGVLLIAALIAIPMWLLIILLSPFDAYLAAKAASSQMTTR